MEVREWFEKKKNKVQSRRCRIRYFPDAIFSGELDEVQKFVKDLGIGKDGLARAFADLKDKEGRTVFHYAAFEGNHQLCQYFVKEVKIDVDLRDLTGKTPLHYAIKGEQFNSAVYLLENGADPNAACYDGLTAMHYAAKLGWKELLVLLISKGGEVNPISKFGTPQDKSAASGQKEAVEILLDNHEKPYAALQGVNPPLFLSILAQSLECVKLLVQAGAYLNIRLRRWTPLQLAAFMGETEIITYLMEAGADSKVNIEDKVTKAYSFPSALKLEVDNQHYQLLCWSEFTSKSTASELLTLGEKGEDDIKDRITALPEDILIKILSLVSIKDAQRHLERERQKFVSCVNKVMTLHRSMSLEKLGFSFFLDSDCFSIKNWIDFARDKRLQMLELNFKSNGVCRSRHPIPFPVQLYSDPTFRTLESLKLTCVNIDEDMVEDLLIQCRLLQELVIDQSSCLKEVRIFGLTLQLRHCGVLNCEAVSDIQIFAPNMVSFCYFGSVIEQPFDNVPNLVEASFLGSMGKNLAHSLHQISGVLSQLEKLTLDVGFKFPRDVPHLDNIRKLDLKIMVKNNKSLLPCASMLKACPLLAEFILKLTHIPKKCESGKVKRIIEDQPYRDLKIFQLIGFGGYTRDIEIIVYLIDNATRIGKVIVDPCSASLLGRPSECHQFRASEEYERLRDLALDLGGMGELPFIVL